MKSYFLTMLVSLFSMACMQGPQQKGKEAQEPLDWSVAKEGTISGLITAAKERVYIVANYTSKSRIHYGVYGPGKHQLAAHVGSYTITRGRILQNRNNPWRKNVYVAQVLVISDHPIESKRLHIRKIDDKN